MLVNEYLDLTTKYDSRT